MAPADELDDVSRGILEIKRIGIEIRIINFIHAFLAVQLDARTRPEFSQAELVAWNIDCIMVKRCTVRCTELQHGRSDRKRKAFFVFFDNSEPKLILVE